MTVLPRFSKPPLFFQAIPKNLFVFYSTGLPYRISVCPHPSDLYLIVEASFINPHISLRMSKSVGVNYVL